jgi:hypothetical protein
MLESRLGRRSCIALLAMTAGLGLLAEGVYPNFTG